MRVLVFALFALPAAALEIAAPALPPAIVHREYLPAPLHVRGGGFCPQNNVSYRVVLGALPPGLELSTAGFFSGTPRSIGLYTFIVKAANPCGYTTRTVSIEVRGAPILVLQPGEGLSFAATQGEALPSPELLRVLSSWPDLAYEISAANAPWLVVRPHRGRTPVEGSGLYGDPVTVSVDPSELAPGVYRATLRVTAWETTNQPEIPVTLTVRPRVP